MGDLTGGRAKALCDQPLCRAHLSGIGRSMLRNRHRRSKAMAILNLPPAACLVSAAQPASPFVRPTALTPAHSRCTRRIVLDGAITGDMSNSGRLLELWNKSI